MQSSPSSTLNTSELKKLEKDIKHEAKDEEKVVKHAMNDLKKTEKEGSKVHKATDKAKGTVEKAEKKEDSTLDDIYKAQHRHDAVVTDLHQAESSLKFKTQKDKKLKEAVNNKAAHLDQVIKANEEHTERNASIYALRGPSAADEAGRIIPQMQSEAPESVN